MGAGGQGEAEQPHLRRFTTEKPPFTLGQIKRAVPPHCFQRSVLRSFSYVFYDLSMVIALLYLAIYHIPKLPSPYAYVAWPLYWFCQGCAAHAYWVLAHDCGHHAFSDYQLLDDAVGFLIHSTLLVPYFSFKHSHRRHHSNGGSFDRDEMLVPRLKSSLPWFTRYITNNPPGRLLFIVGGLTTGWPMYLAFNLFGRSYPRFACHFDPYCPMFNARERAQVVLSDAGVLATLYVLYRLTVAYSLGWVVRIYCAPMVFVNCWLVVTVYLQHAHPALARYDSSEWEWLKGGFATVDRDYGVFNKMFHNITDTHVVHHLFPSMPHYHAAEATAAVKGVLGEYYRFDPTPIWKAVWREVTECVYMEPEGENRKGVYWFNNKL